VPASWLRRRAICCADASVICHCRRHAPCLQEHLHSLTELTLLVDAADARIGELVRPGDVASDHQERGIVRPRRRDDQHRVLALSHAFDNGKVSGMTELPIAAHRAGRGARAAGLKREGDVDAVPPKCPGLRTEPCDTLEGGAQRDGDTGA
jgi:hypothetical protein